MVLVVYATPGPWLATEGTFDVSHIPAFLTQNIKDIMIKCALEFIHNKEQQPLETN